MNLSLETHTTCAPRDERGVRSRARNERGVRSRARDERGIRSHARNERGVRSRSSGRTGNYVRPEEARSAVSKGIPLKRKKIILFRLSYFFDITAGLSRAHQLGTAFFSLLDSQYRPCAFWTTLSDWFIPNGILTIGITRARKEYLAHGATDASRFYLAYTQDIQHPFQQACLMIRYAYIWDNCHTL